MIQIESPGALRLEVIARVVFQVSGIAAVETLLGEAWTAEGLRLPRHEIAEGREVEVRMIDPLGDVLFLGRGCAHADSRGGCRVELFSVSEEGREILEHVLGIHGGAGTWDPGAAREWVSRNRMPMRNS